MDGNSLPRRKFLGGGIAGLATLTGCTGAMKAAAAGYSAQITNSSSISSNSPLGSTPSQPSPMPDNMLSILDFGADPTGTRDSSTAVQAC